MEELQQVQDFILKKAEEVLPQFKGLEGMSGIKRAAELNGMSRAYLEVSDYILSLIKSKRDAQPKNN